MPQAYQPSSRSGRGCSLPGCARLGRYIDLFCRHPALLDTMSPWVPSADILCRRRPGPACCWSSCASCRRAPPRRLIWTCGTCAPRWRRAAAPRRAAAAACRAAAAARATPATPPTRRHAHVTPLHGPLAGVLHARSFKRRSFDRYVGRDKFLQVGMCMHARRLPPPLLDQQCFRLLPFDAYS